MSGRKVGHVIPSQRLQIQRVLGPLAAQLELVHHKCLELLSEDSKTGIVEVRKQLAALRAELKQYKQATPRRETLDAAFDVENLLSRFDALLVSTAFETQFKNVSASIVSVIARGDISHLPTVKSSTCSLIETANKAISLHREAAKVFSEIKREAAAAVAAGSKNFTLEDVAPRAIAAAALDCINHEVDEASRIVSDDLKFGKFDVLKHAAIITEARRAAQQADPKKLDAALVSARSLRFDAAQLAAEMRVRINERAKIAEHLAERLKQLNYDAPDMYLDGEEFGEMAPFVLYATNPSGIANVRVTMPIDGKLIIEINGVAEGEEKTCVSLLEGFAEALRTIEQKFQVTDYGRAQSKVNAGDPVRTTQQVKARERRDK